MRSTLDYAVIAADRRAVEQFIERLAVFGLDQWLSVPASTTHDTNARTNATAALALLLRPLLGEGQFASLYQPFASLVELPVEPLRPIRLVGDDRMRGDPVFPARSPTRSRPSGSACSTC